MRLLFSRKAETESRAFAFFTFYPNITSVSLDSVLGNSQSQSAATLRTGFINLVKAFEYMGQVFFRNTDTVVIDALLLLHPFAPFVTEEIWDKLPGTQGSIMQASFPRPETYALDQETLSQAETQMALVMAIITGIRNIRGEMNIAPAVKLEAALASPQEAVRQAVTEHQELITNLARLNAFTIQADDHHSATAATAIVGEATLLVELKGVVDFAQEAQRLEKEIGKLAKELAGLDKKLSNAGFLAKAPAPVVAEVREKQAQMTEKVAKLSATLAKVKSFS